MENKKSFILAIIYTAFAGLMVYIQLINSPVDNLLFWIGLGIYCTAGGLFIYSTLKDERTFMRIGLLIGVGSWILLLIGSSWGAYINHQIIENWQLWDSLSSYVPNIYPILDNIIDLLDTLLEGINLNLMFSGEVLAEEIFFGPFVYYVVISIITVVSVIIGFVLGFSTFRESGKEKESRAVERKRSWTRGGVL